MVASSIGRMKLNIHVSVKDRTCYVAVSALARDGFGMVVATYANRQSKCQPQFCGLLASPWSATQLRRARFSGGDVRPGNVIERRGKIYQVVKAQHTTQGRGGAIIQVELRDIDSGNKLNERLRTDETVEKVYVKEKSLTYLYTDDETGNVVLMDSETYGQLDVPKHLFGESVVYLQDDMKAEPIKGIGATPHYKKVLLDNGLTIQVPAHILSGDKILVNTTDNSYISKA
ncbi:elongation factor P (EF-P) family protein [Abeliophyllum distichum]|uniref:Elongation factor P (EF-P) family protein n=1 Tax=Abeliophyllum distichum TaxID=126358 RepID=A0ABD1VTW0_9LAMI